MLIGTVSQDVSRNFAIYCDLKTNILFFYSLTRSLLKLLYKLCSSTYVIMTSFLVTWVYVHLLMRLHVHSGQEWHLSHLFIHCIKCSILPTHPPPNPRRKELGAKLIRWVESRLAAVSLTWRCRCP